MLPAIGERVAYDRHQRIGRGRGHELGVVREPREHHRRGFAVVLRRRQRQIVLEQPAAHRLDHVAPGPCRKIVGEIIAEAAHRENSDHGERQPREHDRMLLERQGVLQKRVYKPNREQIRRREHRGADQTDQVQPPVRLRVAQQSRVDMPRLAHIDRAGARVPSHSAHARSRRCRSCLGGRWLHGGEVHLTEPEAGEHVHRGDHRLMARAAVGTNGAPAGRARPRPRSSESPRAAYRRWS